MCNSRVAVGVYFCLLLIIALVLPPYLDRVMLFHTAERRPIWRVYWRRCVKRPSTYVNPILVLLCDGHISTVVDKSIVRAKPEQPLVYRTAVDRCVQVCNTCIGDMAVYVLRHFREQPVFYFCACDGTSERAGLGGSGTPFFALRRTSR